jgi:hydroxyacid-oxoacid transhydrogenase
MTFETAFTMDTSSIRYGPGVTREVGYEMKRLGASCVMLVVDPHLIESESVATAHSALLEAGIEVVIFDGVRCEPTDVSFKAAIRFAAEGEFDGYVAVGGGSTMDTAKIANLYTTYPADFMAYINAPIGEGRPVPGPLKPLIAIPTTAGTGSETTGTAICDLEELHVKTGISHRALRPAMGIIDPLNTRTLSPMATACTGFDVLAHALESLTALPYYKRPAPEHPGLRPAYQGTNPISDVWAAKAIEMVSQSMMRAIEHPEDDEARGRMLLGASFAGIGFGNAGVHLVHGMSYPVSGMARGYIPEGYVSDHPIIPHGMAVVLNAPAVFRFTAPSDPQRHLWGAQLMGVDVSDADPKDAGELLATALSDLMRQAGMPNGLSAVGFSSEDIPALVAGTLPQHRVTKLCPRPFTEADLARMFADAMTCW